MSDLLVGLVESLLSVSSSNSGAAHLTVPGVVRGDDPWGESGRDVIDESPKSASRGVSLSSIRILPWRNKL